MLRVWKKVRRCKGRRGLAPALTIPLGLVASCGMRTPLNDALPAHALAQSDAGKDAPVDVTRGASVDAAGTDALADAGTDARPIQLSAGATHTCAIRSDGTVACWGDNYFGQSTPPEDLAFRSISAGGEHVCGITLGDLAVACWGNDDQVSQPPLLAWYSPL